MTNSLANCSDDSMCPTWFTCDTSQKSCSCGHQWKGAIKCNNDWQISGVLNWYCVTYDDDTNSTYMGSCPYNYPNDTTYKTLPVNPKQLNINFCTQFHRKGLLCGDCEDGYSPFVLSYNLSCVKCPDGHKNWWKFILAGFVPLTFFYFIVVLFNINVTSSRLHGVVWFSQTISMPLFIYAVLLTLLKERVDLILVKIFLVFHSFWNLDIFRSVIPDICLNVTTLQALALEYLVAFYPPLLLLFSHFCIKLYDRKNPFIVMVWMPFQRMLSLFRKFWKIQTSLIDAFATFFLLSYVKIMNVSMDLLIPTEIHKLGSNETTLGLFSAPSVTYFGRDHLPYAILSLIVLILFVITPLLVLILYPFQCFQKLVSIIPLKSNILHAFIDLFQGCYKDGTEPGTLDCRWFSVLIVLIRLFLYIMIAIKYSSDILFLYTIILLILYLIAIVNIQPYKLKAIRYPSTDSQFLIFLTFCFIALLGRAVHPSKGPIKRYETSLWLMTAIAPLLYIIFLIGSWLATKKSV